MQKATDLLFPQQKPKNGATTGHSPDAQWLNWCCENLPQARDFWITDIDTVIRDRKGNICLLELKRFKAVLGHSQRTTYEVLDALLKAGANSLNSKVNMPDGRAMKIKYHGILLLTFEKTSFKDGKAWIGSTEVTEREAIEILSFRKTLSEIVKERKVLAGV